MRNVFKSVLAFLLVNNLLSRELVFLTDGAQNLRCHIREKDRRNVILEKVLRYLWVCDVTSAS